MIKRVTSIQFQEQKGTANRPVLSLCRTANGIKAYYLKYARTKNEIEGLVAELVCFVLARTLRIDTPEHVYGTIGSHVIPEKVIHREHLTEGTITVGSAKYPRSYVREITKLDFIPSKHVFNRLKDPNQVLRIGIFDWWVGNYDRKADNYNLFLSTGRLQKLIIFDHFEAFDDIANNPNREIETEIYSIDRGFLLSEYAKSMLSYINKTELKIELDTVFSLINSIDIDEILTSLFESFPTEWNVKSETITYINHFLSNTKRLENVKESLEYYINYYI